MRALTLLALSLLPACIERVHAQPRPDAGARRFALPRSSALPRARDVRLQSRSVLRTLLAVDAGREAFGGLLGPSAGEADRGRDQLASQAMQAIPDGSVLGALIGRGGGQGAGGLGGLRGSTVGLGTRVGGLGTGPGGALGGLSGGRVAQAYFVEITVQGSLPRQRAIQELSRVSWQAQQCLRLARHASPVDVAVRFVVRPPAVVDEVTVVSAPEVVERCVRESLQRTALGPVTEPSEVSAWFRAAAAVTP